MHRVEAARSSIPLPPPEEKMITGARAVINREGKKEFPFDRDLFFHQDRFDRELPDFHRQHPGRLCSHFVRLLRERDPADASSPCRPRLNLDYDLSAVIPAEFVSRRYHFVGRRCGAATRNLKSIRSENAFALMFVESCHDLRLGRLSS